MWALSHRKRILFAILFFLIVCNYYLFSRDIRWIRRRIRRTGSGPDTCVSFKTLDPWDLDVKAIVFPPNYTTCALDPKYPILFQTEVSTQDLVALYPDDVDLKCCYEPFRRIGDQNLRWHEKCFRIRGNRTTIPRQFEYIAVKCWHPTGRFGLPKDQFIPRIVDLFPLIHPVPKKPLKYQIMPQDDVRGQRPNVLIFGLDATSYLSFRRVFSSSDKFLRGELGAFVMEGYNRVADNTLPNVLPFLSGMTMSEARDTCWTSDYSHFDECPMIWNDFAKLGYRTAFGEDAVYISIFDLDIYPGFRVNPVDHQLHPVSHGQHIFFNYSDGNPACIGSRLWFKDITDFAQKVAFSSKAAGQPFFHFSWATSMMHEQNNNGFLGEGALLKMLKDLQSGGFLENTLLVVMSDHGARYGFMRNSIRGRIEENSPFLYIRPPEWFLKKYPEAKKNLAWNQKRLTTHWDLRETLMDILSHVREGDLDLTPNDEARGISLFRRIPGNRTCEDAGIPTSFCVCQIDDIVELEPTDAVAISAGVVLVDAVNKILEDGRVARYCVPLTLGRVLKAYQTSELGEISMTLIVEARESGGTFEATLNQVSEEFYVTSHVSRTNKYGDQSHCISSHKLKSYCLCPDKFKPPNIFSS